MYFPFLLSYLALRVRGRVAAGDVVLVHAAAGGAGSAAVQLAKAFGATVIATAGTDEKVELLPLAGRRLRRELPHRGLRRLRRRRHQRAGRRRGLRHRGGAVTTETFRVMAFNGRHLIVGYASDIKAEERALSIQPSIYGNFDLVGVCFAFVDSPRTIRPFGMNFLSTAQGVEIWNRVLHLTRAGTIHPVISQQIDFADVPAALEALEHRRPAALWC